MVRNIYNSSLSNFTLFDDEAPPKISISRILSTELLKCVHWMEVQPKPSEGSVYCSRHFDGWSCWNDTAAGEVAYTPCPHFITGFDPNRKAHKACSSDGIWFRHPETNKTWSNYTTCIDMDDLYVKRVINTIFVSGYSISMIALIASLFIFFYFRSLRCTRIRIHKNLFVSFIINNALWILWYREVVDKTEHVVISNEVGCQVLHILVHYFMLASYFWMFCEGVYLHTLLVIAFVSEEKIMRWFYLVGWGIPAIVMAIYGGVRGTSQAETRHCWMNESHYMWILSIPVCISMIINFIFLINIVRVLVTKLRANNISHDGNGTRKAVKATLILIPLLGLHYVLTPFRPEEGSSWEILYQVVSAVVSSLQGFFVALLFCFCNSEVISAVRKKWSQFRFMHERRRRYSCTTAYALSLNGHHGPVLANRHPSPNQKKKDDLLTIPSTNRFVGDADEGGEGPKCTSLLNPNGVRQSDLHDEVHDLEERFSQNGNESKKDFLSSTGENDNENSRKPPCIYVNFETHSAVAEETLNEDETRTQLDNADEEIFVSEKEKLFTSKDR